MCRSAASLDNFHSFHKIIDSVVYHVHQNSGTQDDSTKALKYFISKKKKFFWLFKLSRVGRNTFITSRVLYLDSDISNLLIRQEHNFFADSTTVNSFFFLKIYFLRILWLKFPKFHEYVKNQERMGCYIIRSHIGELNLFLE